VQAIDTVTHAEKWRKPAEFAQDPDWHLVGGHLVYDYGIAGRDSKVVVDPAPGNDGRALGGNSPPDIIGSDGNRLVTSDVAVSLSSAPSHFVVSVLDVATGVKSKGLDIGTEPSRHVTLTGDLLVVLTHDGEVKVARLPGAK
jgi:hypothetical protein